MFNSKNGLFVSLRMRSVPFLRLGDRVTPPTWGRGLFVINI